MIYHLLKEADEEVQFNNTLLLYAYIAWKESSPTDLGLNGWESFSSSSSLIGRRVVCLVFARGVFFQRHFLTVWKFPEIGIILNTNGFKKDIFLT